jgi:hypothetical protein
MVARSVCSPMARTLPSWGVVVELQVVDTQLRIVQEVELLVEMDCCKIG